MLIYLTLFPRPQTCIYSATPQQVLQKNDEDVVPDLNTLMVLHQTPIHNNQPLQLRSTPESVVVVGYVSASNLFQS